jgi:PAS domain-containing protein
MQLKEYAEKLEQLVDEKTADNAADKEKIRGIFESSPSGIIVTDAAGKITSATKQ